MYKKVWISVAMLLLLTGSASAVPVDCNTLSTLAQYIGASDGCFVQDKLFTGFTYSGGGSVTAANVDVDVVFSILPTQDIHGFVFTPAAGSPVWTTGFTLGYTISISPPNLANSIDSAKIQGNFGNLPPNPASVTTTKSNGIVQTVTFGSETDIDVFGGVQSLISSTVTTIPSGGFLISLEETYTQRAVVAEPPTMLLLGSALGALLFLSRRPARTT